MLLRILARESLSIKKREEALGLNQELLKEENTEMNAIFNNMENAIFSLDKDNNIYFANKSAIETFPVLKGKIANKVSAAKISLADSAGKPVTLKEIADSSSVTVYRSDLTANVNGKVASFNSFVTKIFDEKNDYQGSMISLHSLTADEMLEKSRMEFASLASHEIRTPLTVIEGYLSLMLINDGFVYNDMTKEYLTTLHDTTTDLIKLSNGILSMSKIDEGSVRVDIVKTDLSESVKNIVSEQIKLAKARGLDIQYELNKVPIIDTDKTKINEILRNLIENAIKFSTKGVISVILDQQGSEILISVEDSGIGIPESSKDKIFSKFYQVENWDTRKVSGTGLGLYVSKSMAKRIGGDLVLETTSKKGSKFTLILPVKYPILDDLKKHKDIKLKEFIEGF
jgi:two-component system phosphate regulon sensor histidine kinase PhoR